MRPRVWRAAALVLITLLSGGCWDHQPPETSAFVLMIGVDNDPENPAQMTVTQVIAIPSALTAGGTDGAQSQGTPFYLLSSTGRAVEDAQFVSRDHLSRIPRLEHMVALVLGEEFARSGISGTIDWVIRHPQVRPGTWLFVSESSAQMFLDARPALDPLPGAAILGLIRHVDRISSTMPIKVYEFAQTILSPRKDGFAPLVRRVNPLLSQVPAGFIPRPFAGLSFEEPVDTQIHITGLAIFKGDRMVGTLTGPEASGLVWIAGTSKARVDVPHPTIEGHFLTALAITTSTKKATELRDDQLVLTVDVRTTMDIWEAGALEPLAVSSHVPAIKKALEDGIEGYVQRTMKELQSLRADIFGFAEELYRSAPAEWRHIAPAWDDLYEQAKVEVTVNVHLRRSGLAR